MKDATTLDGVTDCTGCDEFDCQECCEHEDHDHGFCLDCGKDVTNRLAVLAESCFEGDR